MGRCAQRAAMDAPGPLTDYDAALEARIRLKQNAGEPLDDEERGFLARMPADKEIPPREVQRRAQ